MSSRQVSRDSTGAPAVTEFRMIVCRIVNSTSEGGKDAAVPVKMHDGGSDQRRCKTSKNPQHGNPPLRRPQ